MVDKPQTPKEPEKETPPGTGTEGKPPETPPAPPGLTAEERAELEKLRRQFPESAKEAQRLAKRVKELEDKLEQSGATLSDEELRKEDPDYDLMSEEERIKFKNSVKIKRELAILKAKQKMREEYESLPDKMRKEIEEKGGYEVFRDFACSPENAGQKSILNIAKAFLFKEKEETEEIPPKVEERPGLETEETTPPKPPAPKEGEMTAEQAAELRTKDPKKYTELVKAKKLKII